MKIEPNLCGTPLYLEPYPRQKFCDFAKREVTVCHSCFLSIGRIDLQQHPDESPYFNKDAFIEIWNNQCPEFKKTINNLPINFALEERTFEQILLYYDIAIETHQVLKQVDGSRYLCETAMMNLKHQEMRMNSGDQQAAKMNLKSVESILWVQGKSILMNSVQS